ncbi:MAG: hypothetical protein ACEQSE_05580 [Candidatus Aquirickettsiella gammari]
MTKLIRAFFAMSMLTLLSACGGGGGSAGNTSGVALFTTAPEKVTVIPGATQTYNIGGGVPSYIATSSNSAARVVIDGSVLTVIGTGTGVSTIAITDRTGSKLLIEATIGTGADFYVNLPDQLTLGVGLTSSTFSAVGGSGVYSVVSGNPNIVSISATGGRFTLTGVSAGTTSVIVSDTLGGNKKIDVTVGNDASTKLFTSAPTNLTMAPTIQSNYIIGGGVAPYTVASSNENVVAAIMNGASFRLNAIATGNTSVSIRDAKGETVVVSVSVAVNGATIPLDVLPGDASGSIGDELVYQIVGGSLSYSLTSNNPNIAIVSKANVVANEKFTIQLKNAGSTEIVIVDSAGSVKKITIGVSASQPQIRMSPSSFVFGEDSTAKFVLQVTGGSGVYNVFTSDLRISKVSIAGNTVTIEPGENKNFCVTTVTPGSTTTVTITVVDSLGGTATTNMLIKDNAKGGAGCA